jgi:hypothetical protein
VGQKPWVAKKREENQRKIGDFILGKHILLGLRYITKNSKQKYLAPRQIARKNNK